MSLDLSLFQIEDGLRDLYAMREEARQQVQELNIPPDSDYAPSEVQELAVIDKAIRDYIGAEIKKVDGTADFILMLDRLCHEQRERKGGTERCELDREIDRLKARRDQFRSVLAHVKDAVKFVMEGMSWREGKPKKLEGVRHSLTLRGNGGAQPVVVTDETLVPDEYCQVTVTMTADLWRSVSEHVYQCESTGEFDGEIFQTLPKRTPRLSAIAEALNAPCPHCKGQGLTDQDSDGPCPSKQCSECQGTGKQSVAGCHLGPRGESVVVK